ncbi:MAG: hypothetical protein CMQ46_03405 [Gammaproteobacteria bacterium]|nr:hypothetical protein [Gammaproteobacteria bacterium]MBJ54295.1 hypothetical protein [Gammaproteobacteria bacterium]HBN13870.1 hypothetical protein [Pseudohongiella sp.]
MSEKNEGKVIKPIETRMASLVFVANLVPSAALIALLVLIDASVYVIGIVAVLSFFLSVFSVTTVWRMAQYHFQSVHNLLDAIVCGDYSFRGAHEQSSGAYGELIKTINALAVTIQRQRMQSQESQVLIRKVLEQIDVAILSWDESHQIHLINPAAKSLIGVSSEAETIQQPSEEVCALIVTLEQLKVGEMHLKDMTIGNERGRYRIRLERFITDGDTHYLVFLTNVSSILRSEERRAWRNLVRVLSHEINNSLAPLRSFSRALSSQIDKREADAELKQELLDGLNVIGNRADSLISFVQSYHKVARLPEPSRQKHDFRELVVNLADLFSDNHIVVDGQSITVSLDVAQIEQVMINLIKNAIEAGSDLEPIEINWRRVGNTLAVNVLDSGPGIHNADNLFTPFYTTKPKGSGIGLVFSQQVVEAHGGHLDISNRDDATGCRASFTLPIH